VIITAFTGLRLLALILSGGGSCRGKEKLNRLAAGEYAVIYITEQLAAQLSA
jgi:vacuolar-type H+-ATPase subunit F/Vma7